MPDLLFILTALSFQCVVENQTSSAPGGGGHDRTADGTQNKSGSSTAPYKRLKSTHGSSQSLTTVAGEGPSRVAANVGRSNSISE